MVDFLTAALRAIWAVIARDELELPTDRGCAAAGDVMMSLAMIPLARASWCVTGYRTTPAKTNARFFPFHSDSRS